MSLQNELNEAAAKVDAWQKRAVELEFAAKKYQSWLIALGIGAFVGGLILGVLVF